MGSIWLGYYYQSLPSCKGEQGSPEEGAGRLGECQNALLSRGHQESNYCPRLYEKCQLLPPPVASSVPHRRGSLLVYNHYTKNFFFCAFICILLHNDLRSQDPVVRRNRHDHGGAASLTVWTTITKCSHSNGFSLCMFGHSLPLTRGFIARLVCVTVVQATTSSSGGSGVTY